MSNSLSQKVLVTALVMLGLVQNCLAHDTGLSTSDLKFGTNHLNAEVILAAADLTLLIADLDASTPLDVNHDGKVASDELSAGIERLRKFAIEALLVEFDGQRVQPGTPKLTLDEKNNFHIELSFPGQRPGRLRVSVTLFQHLPASHMHFVSVHDVDDAVLDRKMLKPTENVLEISLSGRADKSGAAEKSPRANTFLDFLKLGVEHIWTGYDHLLFLLALLLVCKDFKSAVQVVTFFTLAHSITLAFATLNLVSVSSRVTEPAIAASIIYVGVENFVRREGPKGRWLITFLFGLIHGFGFATVLRDLGVASSTTGVAVPLVAFNLGVELGQIVIAGILLPVIWKLRKWNPFLRWGVPVCSAVVAAAGTYWLIQRVFFN